MLPKAGRRLLRNALSPSVLSGGWSVGSSGGPSGGSEKTCFHPIIDSLLLLVPSSLTYRKPDGPIRISDPSPSYAIVPSVAIMFRLTSDLKGRLGPA